MPKPCRDQDTVALRFALDWGRVSPTRLNRASPAGRPQSSGAGRADQRPGPALQQGRAAGGRRQGAGRKRHRCRSPGLCCTARASGAETICFITGHGETFRPAPAHFHYSHVETPRGHDTPGVGDVLVADPERLDRLQLALGEIGFDMRGIGDQDRDRIYNCPFDHALARSARHRRHSAAIGLSRACSRPIGYDRITTEAAIPRATAGSPSSPGKQPPRRRRSPRCIRWLRRDARSSVAYKASP
jgi:hypothetical protein